MWKIFLLASLLSASNPVINENPISLNVIVDPNTIRPGSETNLIIEANIAPDHHAYKDMFKVQWAGTEGVTLDPISITPTKSFFDPFTKRTREAAEGQTSVTAKMRIPQNIKPGSYIGQIKLTYQICSAKYCLFPKTVTLDVPWHVSLNADSKSDPFADAMARGVFWVYLFAFIGGFLTSLTPCVFPMIPITISIIGARTAGNRKSRSFLLSLTYVLGIAFTYSLLGVIAASTGALFGSALSNPVVVISISLIFVIMGLSMLGLFEIQVPGFIRNKFGNANTGSGMPGAFLAGLFAGIVASPCIGPVLVSILAYVAQTAEIFFGFTLLFTFAVGMGMIFIVLGTFSGMLSKLPKSGPWMEKIKYIFAIIFFAMAIYYIKPLIPTSWFSFIKITQESPNSSLTSLSWQNFSEQAFQAATKDKRPVIIDFTAEWCEACHELEKYTYTNSEVLSLGEKFIKLKVDATKPSAELDKLKTRFKVLGLPTVLFVDNHGHVRKDLTVTGFVDATDFSARMKKTLE